MICKRIMLKITNFSQFAVVHYFTKNGSGEVYFNDTSSSESESDDDHDFRGSGGAGNSSSGGGGPCSSGGLGMGAGSSSSCQFAGLALVGHPQLQQMAIIDMPPPLKINNGGGLGGSGEDSPSGIPGCPQRHAQPRNYHHHRRDSAWNFCARKKRDKLRQRQRMELENVNSVSKVDKFARIFFPLSFLCINVFYWYSYLYKSSDI